MSPSRDPSHDAVNSVAPARETGVQAFASTHWSLVLLAGQRGTAASDSALAALCESYWAPLYAYVRRCIPNEHEAQDLTQTFLARLIEKNYLNLADPARGRFRTFLLTAIQHCIANERRDARAQKRGGGRSPLSLDFDSVHPLAETLSDDSATPEQEFDRQWAVTLLARVMQRLEREQLDAGKSDQFQCLKGFLVGDRAAGGFAAAAQQLGMTEPAARMAASRLRARYRELLRGEIAQTVATPEQIDEEIADLFRIFADG